MEAVFVLIIGLIIGSFLNVCIYRIPKEESISFPPSHCTNCGYQLKVIDLVPIFSYIFLKGKCRNCKEKISIRYPLIELVNGLLYLSVYLKFGMSVGLVKFCIFSSLLLVIGMIDFDTKYVFTSTVLFGIITGAIFIFIEWIITGNIPWDNIAGAAIGFLVIWLIVTLTHGMGEGDIDISVICGLFLGVKGISVTLFLAVILGGIVAVIILLCKLKNKKSEIAFGPYLAIGGIVSMLFASNLIDIYVNVFF